MYFESLFILISIPPLSASASLSLFPFVPLQIEKKKVSFSDRYEFRRRSISFPLGFDFSDRNFLRSERSVLLDLSLLSFR